MAEIKSDHPNPPAIAPEKGPVLDTDTELVDLGATPSLDADGPSGIVPGPGHKTTQTTAPKITPEPTPDTPPPPPSTWSVVWKWLRRFLLFCCLLLVLALIGGFVAFLEFRAHLMAVSTESKKIVVEIPPGSGVRSIGRQLQEAGVVRSAEAFFYYVAYRRVGGKLKAGEQVLDSSLNTPEVVDTLIRGNFKLYPVTVPEGLTMAQIAVLAAKTGLTTEKEFLDQCRDRAFIASLGLDVNSLEGYLFPETYNFTKAAGGKEIVKAMVERFKHVWERLRPPPGIHGLSRNELVTLASIVEKETAAAAERPLVARVFLNRLKKGMRLETDPTVIYGIKDFSGNLTKKDLQTPTPYNTYLIMGLPPGPIANPGEESLKAVLEPASSDYLFFVSKNDGTHHFSRTLAEHNKAVDLYQRGKGQK